MIPGADDNLLEVNQEMHQEPRVKDVRERRRKSASMYEKCAVGLSEFVATAILVFLSCLGCVPGMSRGADVGVLQASVAGGMAVMITIFLFGHISGAHVNPLTTVSAVIIGKIQPVLVPIYLLGEILGSLTGYGLLKLVVPEQHMRNDNVTTASEKCGICTTVPSPELNSAQAVTVEILLSLVLVFANCSTWDPRNAKNTDSTPLRFGFLITCLSIAGAYYTGPSMNPARSFGPAFWTDCWQKHWVYWLGPLTAAVLGSLFYRVFFLDWQPFKH